MSLSEIISDSGRRRQWSAAEKVRIFEKTLDGRESISLVAGRNGVAPNFLYRWPRLMPECEGVAPIGDDDVTSNREAREMESRIRELELQLGRKTLELEILTEALDRSRPKKATLLMRSPPPEDFRRASRLTRSAWHVRRSGGPRAMTLVEMLTDNGSAYTARETSIFARQLGLKPCLTPVRSPQSNGISEAFGHTLQRDYISVSPLPDAHTALTSLAGWIEDDKEHHPHSCLKMCSPCEHRAMGSTIA